MTTAGVGQLDLLDRSEIAFVEPDRDCWASPWAWVHALSWIFGPFDLDACAQEATAKAVSFFTVVDNGLMQAWGGRVYCNPPWSDIEPWIKKGADEVDAGRAAIVVYSLPARTGTAWYQLLKEREGKQGALLLHPPGRLAYEAPPGAKESSNMEDTLVAVVFKPLLHVGAYRKAA